MERPPVLTMTDAAVAQAKTLLARGDGEVLAFRVHPVLTDADIHGQRHTE